jgi:acetamidase/formamidase
MDRIVAQPPNPTNVHAGSASSDIKEKVGSEGARTIPGRPEHGGNCDIKNLSRGSKVYLPVHVAGAKFSVGDLHFSQGDGEISFCGAIEMAGVITLKFTVMKGGVKQLDMKSPIYIPGPVEPQFGPGRYIYFEGFSVDEHGKQHYMDATVAYRQTCLRAIEYLRRFGMWSLLCVCAVGTVTDVGQDTMTIRSTCCSRARRCKGISRAWSISRMRARRWGCRWISLTLTSRRMRRWRRGIWGLVLLLVVRRWRCVIVCCSGC